MATAEYANVEMQPNIAAKELYLSPMQFMSYHECAKKAYFDELSIRYEEMEKKRVLKAAVRLMFKQLQEGYDPSNAVEQFLDSDYKKEWFESELEYSLAYERARQKVIRVQNYIFENGYKVVKTGYPYKIGFPSVVNLNGISTNGFAGKFDCLLEKDGKYIAVMLKNGKPKYSSRARKQENRPENSIELTAAYLCISQVIPNAQVALWYLNNKDDTAELMPFEHRKEKNIVQMDFKSMNGSEVWKRFLFLIQLQAECNCEKCIHACVCQKEAVRMDERVDEKQAVSSSAISFTEKQQQVIDHVNGPMCVVAVPGAGKTKALVSRMVSLIEKGVSPYKILFISFTKKACSEIQERVEKELAKSGITKKPAIMTFNSLGYSILKENPLYVGGKRLKLADESERYRLIYDAIVHCNRIKGMSYEGIRLKHGLIRQLDKLFQEIDEKEMNHPGRGEEFFSEIYGERKDVNGILAVYHYFKKQYAEEGYISYDEQITLVNELFEEYPLLKRKYAEMYEYIMVDEFQDTSRENAELIYSIAKIHNNIVVVGDDDQSIYGWRGGTSYFMLHFKDDFPGAKIIRMSDNFRSDAEIIAASDCLIQGNGMRYEKHIVSHGENGLPPVYIKGSPKYLATACRQIMKAGCKPGDICVLARNNKRLEQVKSILEEVDIPVTLAKDYLVKDAVFTIVYDVLTLYYEGMEKDVPFYRLMDRCGVIPFKTDKRASLYLNMLTSGRMFPIEENPECLKKYAQDNLSDDMRFGSRLLSCFNFIKGGNIKRILECIISEFVGIKTHKVIETLCDMAEEQGISSCKKLYGMMKDMVLFDTTERVGYDVSPDSVNLLTSHDSKGKEFKTVFIYGIEDYQDTEDEIRVLYVSMTRARKNLYLLETAIPENTAVYEKLEKHVSLFSEQ